MTEGAIISRARQTLPSAISDMLAIIFKRVDQIHRQRLEVELAWTREWTRLHVAVLELYLRVAVQVHQEWSRDLKRVNAAVAAWGARVDAMVRPEREKLLRCFERQAADWLQFCNKYAQAMREQGLDVSTIIEEQKALLATMPSPEEMGWGARLPMSSAIQSFMQQCENPGDRAQRTEPPPAQARAQERLDEQRRRLEQLHQMEDALLRNRRAKHRVWSAMQQQQLSSAAVEQIRALEEEYHAQQREACLLATLVREDTPGAEDHAPPPEGGGEDAACPPAAPQRMDLWRRCAAKMLPAAQRLEQRMLEVEGTPKKLHRIVLETHDEFIRKALSSICAHLHKLRAQQVDGLRAKLSLKSEELQRSGVAARQQMQTLLEEAADHCRAHPEAFRSLYQLHQSIRQRQEAEARHAARRHSLEQVRGFMERDANLRALLQANAGSAALKVAAAQGAAPTLFGAHKVRQRLRKDAAEALGQLPEEGGSAQQRVDRAMWQATKETAEDEAEFGELWSATILSRARDAAAATTTTQRSSAVPPPAPMARSAFAMRCAISSIST